MRETASSLRRYYETIRRLHPEQVRFQVQRRLLAWRAPRVVVPPTPVPEAPGWGLRARRCRMPADPAVLEGTFTAWGRTCSLDLDAPWLEPTLGASWNYPVQYCEYLLPLADEARANPQRAQAIASFIEHWIDAHPPGTTSAWDPYPTALRIVAWLDVVHTLGSEARPAWRQRVLESVYVQAGWLSGHLERHLLGTHLLKDLKALLVAGACFDDARARGWRAQALPLLQRELQAQIDGDGAHVEPSLMYHCVALEDALDLLNFEGAVDAATAGHLEHAVGRMLGFARAMQSPDGGYPLVGDAWEGGAPSPRALLDYARRLGFDIDPAPAPGMTLFAHAGRAVWRDADVYVAADLGGMGPPHLSGHGHCDSLAFELWIDGQPWIVDSGTWSYEPGPQRLACRGTRAHNTLEIDGHEQHEIWNAFRVARRSEVRATALSPTCVEGTLIPWFDRSLRVRRRIELRDACMQVHDVVEGGGAHAVRSRFHVHPDCKATREGDRVVLRRDGRSVVMEIASPTQFEIEHRSGGHARHAGIVHTNSVVVISHDGALPFATTTTIRRA